MPGSVELDGRSGGAEVVGELRGQFHGCLVGHGGGGDEGNGRVGKQQDKKQSRGGILSLVNHRYIA